LRFGGSHWRRYLRTVFGARPKSRATGLILSPSRRQRIRMVSQTSTVITPWVVPLERCGPQNRHLREERPALCNQGFKSPIPLGVQISATVSTKISCRFETLPGQEAQVDFGEGAPTRDARSGKYRKPRLFVLSLSFSRHAFRKVVWRSSQQIWCELHEEAFAHFGGVPEWIRLDYVARNIIELMWRVPLCARTRRR
jgi:hypothetical protein